MIDITLPKTARGNKLIDETNSKKKRFEYPKFSFRFNSANKKYWVRHRKFPKIEKEHLLDKISVLSLIKWKDIYKSNRHGIGLEKINKALIKVPIPNIIAEDINFFKAFRYHGKASMIGYEKQGVFYIVWVDHDYKVYKHG